MLLFLMVEKEEEEDTEEDTFVAFEEDIGEEVGLEVVGLDLNDSFDNNGEVCLSSLLLPPSSFSGGEGEDDTEENV